MHSLAKLILASAAALIVASSTLAKDNDALVIKGKVIGDDGKPVAGSDVRVKATDRTSPDKVVRTDSRGQYIVLGLVPGNYSVTAYDAEGVARSRALIKTRRTGWAKVDFDLGLENASDDPVNRGTGQVIVISGHIRGAPP